MNKLYQQLNQTNLQLPNNIKQMMNMMRGSNNPTQLLSTLAQQNPQVRQIMEMVRNSNMSPKDLFYKMAKEKGVNPDDILNQLK